VPGPGGIDLITLTKVAGTAHTFRGHLRVRRWVGNGTWKAYGVLVEDRIGNYRVYLPRKLDSLGFRHTLSVTSRSDAGAPRIASFTLRPTPIDIRISSKAVTVSVHATDALSGIGKASVNLEPIPGDSALLKIRLHRVSGTRRDGIWVGTATLSRCAPVLSLLRGNLVVIDRTGNRSHSTAKFAVQAVDHVAPSADLPDPDAGVTVKPGGPLVLPFYENVNGISTTSAVVREELADGSPGPVVQGSWICQTGTAAPTDCMTGTVRTARFTPTNGFTVAHWYDVELNPEFTLGITDLAGNPFRRAVGSFYVTN
jgi:hypothetical protein